MLTNGGLDMIKVGTTLKDGTIYAGRYFSLFNGWIHIVAEKEDITTEFYKANISEANDIGEKRGTRVPSIRELKIMYKEKYKIGNFTVDDYISSEETMEYSIVNWPLGYKTISVCFLKGKTKLAAGTGIHSRGDCRLVKTVSKKELKELLCKTS